ncbi:MAG: protein tyrosine phosphatase family protein, partial [Pseudomonadota bacterium]
QSAITGLDARKHHHQPLIQQHVARIAATLLGVFAIVCGAQAADFVAPNLVEISPRIITSGQPTTLALAALGKQNVEVVIFLVPDGISSNVPGEAAILQRQGITFVHIPIPFGAPTVEHYAAFAGAMTKYADKKVLVHCEINLRASSMVFLYRVIALKEDTHRAYEAVAKVWSPRGAWKPFLQDILRKHAITFEPY